MNKKIKSIAMFIVFVTIFGVFGAATPASAMTCNSATIQSTVSTYDHPVSAHFNYSTNYNTAALGEGIQTPPQTIAPNSYIEQYISGLTENTTYYFKLIVPGQAAGTDVNNFTTPSCNTQTTQNPRVNLTANPSNIQYGGSSTLSWNSSNATSCSAYWTNLTGTSGSEVVSPTSTTTYSITCYGSNGTSATDNATVTVANQQTQAPTVHIYANPSSVSYNGSSIVTWNSTNATYCNLTGGNLGWTSNQNTSGSQATGPLTYTTTYSITCYGSNGQSATDSTTVYVNQNNNQAPTVNIYANPTTISYNSSSIITWNSVNASYCNLTGGNNNWNSNQGVSGSQSTGPLTNTTTYTITCYGTNGQQATASTTVYVNGIQQQPVNNYLTVVTTPATNILANSAQLNSLIGNSGNNSSANAWFEWGTSINLGNRTNTTAVGSLPSVVHADTLTGLTAGTTYYFRAVAENASQRAVGSILSFTTLGIRTVPITITRTPGSAVVLVTSSVNRDQPIVPTLDNTRPHPGDQINYTIDYQNVGNASVTNLTLQTTLPSEVVYISSVPTNPIVNGNTLIFNLGTLRAGASGQVTIKTQVLESAAAGTLLNFPATLSYIDPSGQYQTANANISATVYSATTGTTTNLGAFVFGSGFLPTNVFGWLLLFILILLLVLLAKYLYGSPSRRQTTTTIDQKPLSKKTTTTTVVHE